MKYSKEEDILFVMLSMNVSPKKIRLLTGADIILETLGELVRVFLMGRMVLAADIVSQHFKLFSIFFGICLKTGFNTVADI